MLIVAFGGDLVGHPRFGEVGVVSSALTFGRFECCCKPVQVGDPAGSTFLAHWVIALAQR